VRSPEMIEWMIKKGLKTKETILELTGGNGPF
jgi:hypothetical protein